jgi:hypothetical protein
MMMMCRGLLCVGGGGGVRWGAAPFRRLSSWGQGCYGPKGSPHGEVGRGCRVCEARCFVLYQALPEAELMGY